MRRVPFRKAFRLNSEEMMNDLPIAAVLFAAFACSACGGNSTPPVPSDPFVGKWTCTETRTLTFATPAGTPQAVATTRAIVGVSPSNDSILMTAQTEAGVHCSLSFSEKEASATLASGQSCPTVEGMTLTYTMGTADVGDSGLHTNLNFDFTGMLPDSSGGAPLDASGTGTAVSACSRIVPISSSGPTGGGGW
jgi:hypothetical protein